METFLLNEKYCCFLSAQSLEPGAGVSGHRSHFRDMPLGLKTQALTSTIRVEDSSFPVLPLYTRLPWLIFGHAHPTVTVDGLSSVRRDSVRSLSQPVFCALPKPGTQKVFNLLPIPHQIINARSSEKPVIGISRPHLEAEALSERCPLLLAE